MSKKIIIVDYGLGNLFSVQHAFSHLGVTTLVSSDKETILNADALVLPGVGAFGEAMHNLNELQLVEPIKNFIEGGKPFLGVCLGMQLLFTESEEFGNSNGLNIIPGKIRKFAHTGSNGIPAKVPQIAWNRISKPKDCLVDWSNTILKYVEDGEYMYFVHSYYVEPENRENILSETNYEGFVYCSSVVKNNVFATQFHPEKSAIEGLKIYKNWLKLFK